MNKININVDSVKNRIKNINGKKYLVVKSNFYGFGYDLIRYLNNIYGLVVTNIDEYNILLKYIDVTKYDCIILYPENDLDRIKQQNLSVCINSMDMLYKIRERGLIANSYLRVDPFLGLHGIPLQEIEWLTKNFNFKGIFLHINEFLDIHEKNIFDKIVNYSLKNNLNLNVGGSSALQYIKNTQFIEKRFAINALYSHDNTTSFGFSFEVDIINYLIVQEPVYIGYKSSRTLITDGTIFLISAGYYDTQIFNLLYKNKVKILKDQYSIEVPCYPCMNTCWLYINDTLNAIEPTLKLFDTHLSVKYICDALDIDVDEFFSSFNNNIKRNYL